MHNDWTAGFGDAFGLMVQATIPLSDRPLSCLQGTLAFFMLQVVFEPDHPVLGIHPLFGLLCKQVAEVSRHTSDFAVAAVALMFHPARDRTLLPVRVDIILATVSLMMRRWEVLYPWMSPLVMDVLGADELDLAI